MTTEEVIVSTLAPALERVAVELLGIVARLVTDRNTARALLDAAYATMEATVDELEAAKLEALAVAKGRGAPP